MDRFEFDAAKQFIDRALVQEPENEKALTLGGIICLEKNDFDGAREV